MRPDFVKAVQQIGSLDPGRFHSLDHFAVTDMTVYGRVVKPDFVKEVQQIGSLDLGRFHSLDPFAVTHATVNC